MSLPPHGMALGGRRLPPKETLYDITLDPVDAPPVQCEAFTIRWTGGTAPFVVHLHDGDEHTLRSLEPLTDDRYTCQWDPVDLPAGTRLFVRVLGSDDSESRISDPFVVQPGPISTCLSGSSLTRIFPGSPEPPTPIPTTTPATQSTTSPDIFPTPTSSLTTTSNSSSSSSDLQTTDAPSPHIVPAASSPEQSLSILISSSRSLSATSVASIHFVVPPPAPATRTSYSSSSPIPTSSLSSGQVQHPSAGYTIGIAMGVGCVAICGAFAFWHVKRRRANATASLTGSFIANHTGRLWRSNPHPDKTKILSSEASSGDQSAPNVRGNLHTQDNTSLGPFVARASSMGTGSLDCSGYLSSKTLRENVDWAFMPEKLLQGSWHPNFIRPGTWDSDARTRGMGDEGTVSYDQNTVPRGGSRYETDGGVKLAGGRDGEGAIEDVDSPESIKSGCSTLPPPYSSDLGHGN